MTNEGLVRRSPKLKNGKLRLTSGWERGGQPPKFTEIPVGGVCHILPSLKLAAKAPENGWLEYDCFLLGPGLISVSFAVSFRECKTI